MAAIGSIFLVILGYRLTRLSNFVDLNIVSYISDTWESDSGSRKHLNILNVQITTETCFFEQFLLQ